MIEKLVRKFLYYPLVLRKEEPIPPYASGAEEVWIKSADGNDIHGLHWKAKEDRPTLLYLHGNAQSVYEWALVREELLALDCGMLLIDYPGYGKSSGTPTESSLYAAGHAALEWLTGAQNIAEKEILVLGKSLGGGVTCEILQGKTIKGVILESTFSSIPAVASKLIPEPIEGMIFKTERYDSVLKVPKINSPILIVHGTADELIPFAEAEKLYDAASEPKKIYSVQGGHHNDVSMVAGAEYGLKLRQWLDGLV